MAKPKQPKSTLTARQKKVTSALGSWRYTKRGTVRTWQPLTLSAISIDALFQNLKPGEGLVVSAMYGEPVIVSKVTSAKPKRG